MREEVQKIIDNVGKVIIGKEAVLQKLLAAILADGHVLLEDVPGGSIAVAEAVGALLFIFAPQLVRLFSDDPDVIRAGAAQARIEAFFYFLPAISHGSAGLLRGVGKAFVPMLVLLASWCIFRVVFVSIALSFSHSVAIIYAAYPITWTISSIIFIFYLRHSDWLKGGKIG